jgi:hypothetical protein
MVLDGLPQLKNVVPLPLSAKVHFKTETEIFILHFGIVRRFFMSRVVFKVNMNTDSPHFTFDPLRLGN